MRLSRVALDQLLRDKRGRSPQILFVANRTVTGILAKQLAFIGIPQRHRQLEAFLGKVRINRKHKNRARRCCDLREAARNFTM